MKTLKKSYPLNAAIEQHSGQSQARPGPQRGGRKTNHIDFAEVKSRAENWVLEILEVIAPEGELQGNEYVLLNPHRNDGGLGSFKFNIDKNVYSDFADDEVKGSGIIDLVAYYDGLKPVDAARKVNDIIDKLEHVEQSGTTPVTTVKIKAKAKPVKKPTTPVIPVPADAPPAPDFHFQLGKSTARYTYADADNRLVCHVHRFDPAGQRKMYLPQTYRKGDDGQLSWAWLGLDDQRPLYNLRELVTRPDDPVIFVEGEKAANAAKCLFPERVVVTTMGGAQAPDKTDLCPLMGRSILLWPDNDEAGKKYVENLTKLLGKQDPEADILVLHVPDVHAQIIEGQPALVPGFIAPQGWDAADAVNEGWTAEHIKLLPPTAVLTLPVTPDTPALISRSPRVSLVSQMPDHVEKFLHANFCEGLVYSNGFFQAFTAGYWRKIDDLADLKNSIARHLAKEATPQKIETIFSLLQVFLALPEAVFIPDKRMICMRNGTLNTDTYSLEEHSPNHGLVNKLDIEWDETATCPRWLQFLDEVFINDFDKAQKIAFLQQWFGYCLTPDVSQHKFVWMVGAGGNGKSVLLSILQELVGVANVGHAQIERFDSGYVRAELEGKLLNISSEMSATATISDGYLKAITGGGSIEAERKYKQPHTFKPFARLIAATNNLPRLLDNSDGFARRAVILTFNRQFSEQEKDPNLEQTLLKELPGIAVWAIDGLKNLRATGKFELPASSAIELASYRTESDPVALFAQECLVPCESKGVTPTNAYDQYHEWSKRSGFQALNKINFGKRLAALGFGKHRSGGRDFWLLEISELDQFTAYTIKKEIKHPCDVPPTNPGPKTDGKYKF